MYSLIGSSTSVASSGPLKMGVGKASVSVDELLSNVFGSLTLENEVSVVSANFFLLIMKMQAELLT